MSKSIIRVGRWLIYGLLDRRTQCLFYVGKTHKKRELRLAEHIKAASEGKNCKVYKKIREMLEIGIEPDIFVLEKISPENSWQEAERRHIAYWKSLNANQLPITIPPQTAKSYEVIVVSVDLLNMQAGG